MPDHEDLRSKLDNMSKDELNILGKQFGVAGYRKCTKKDLVEQLVDLPGLRKALYPTLWSRYCNHVYGVAGVIGVLLTIAFFVWPETAIKPPEFTSIGPFDIASDCPAVAFAFPDVDLPCVCNLPLGIENPNETELENYEVTVVLNDKYASVLPESYSDRKEFFRVNPNTSPRTTFVAENITSSTNHYELLGPNLSHLILEPIVFNQTYMDLVAKGDPPLIDVDVSVRAKDTPERNFRLQIQAVWAINEEGKVKFKPKPFGNRKLVHLVLAPILELNSYNDLPCYVAEMSSIRSELISRDAGGG